MATDKKIIKQLARSITTMARFDYPESWTNLHGEI